MPKLGCLAFGKLLIESKDLDPVYVLTLENKDLYEDKRRLKRWLLAYWSFYHMGTASWIAEKEVTFWPRFEAAANSKDYPRCTERRYFRGKAASKSYDYLKSIGIDDLFSPLERDQSCSSLMKEVGKWYGFGPWISFKVADMIDALNLAAIEFKTEDVYLFDSPLEGARRLRQSLSANVSDSDLPAWAVSYILSKLGHLKAPPSMARNIDTQEAETVLCKWKSYTNNSYHIGEDIHSCLKSLQHPRTKCQLTESLTQTWSQQLEACYTKIPQLKTT